MDRKKAKSLLKFGGYVAAVLAILAVLTIFLPVVKDYLSYTGLDIVFGNSNKGITLGPIFEFSFLALLTYLLPLGGIVLSLLNRKGTRTLFSVLSAIFYIAGSVFMFLLPLNYRLFQGLHACSLGYLALTPWSIIGGVLLCLSGLISLANVFCK